MSQIIFALVTFVCVAENTVCGSVDVDHLEMLQRSAANLESVEHEVEEEDEHESEGSAMGSTMPWQPWPAVGDLEVAWSRWLER